MKKSIIIVLLCIALVGCIFFAALTKKTNSDSPLRLHIRADSNSQSDQSVKLLVRDKIVLLLEDELSGASDVSQAKRTLKSLLGKIETEANRVLLANGKSYKAKARISNEYFPTRMYGDLVLESGYYDALILELGSGAGDNWWCVVYPPLCYVDVVYGDSFRYKSKIKEIWDKYFG